MDEKYMTLAINKADEALKNREVPVGCVIIYDNMVIASGCNDVNATKNATRHAEMIAIEQVYDWCKQQQKECTNVFKDCTLYVTTEPCIMCAGAAFWTQIERIVYAASDNKRGFSSLKKTIFHPKTQLKKGVLEKESVKLLSNFFKEKR